MNTWVSYTVNVKPKALQASLTLQKTESIRASRTLQETRNIHDSMNIPKIEFIS